MRIGIDARAIYSPNIKGIGVYLYNLLMQIKEIDKKNEYIIYYDTRQNNVFRLPKISNFIERGICINMGDRFYFWDQLKLPIEIKKDRVNIFHSPANTTVFFSSCPIVVTVHDTTLQEIFGTTFNNFYYRKFQSFVLKKARKIIAVSDHTKKRINEIVNIPNEKIEVIHNGISKSFKMLTNKDSIETVKQKYGVQGKYILNVGGESPWKNVSGLIKAYAILVHNFNYDKLLVITGIRKKTILEKHTKEIIELKLSGKVMILGFIEEEDLINLYNGAELFVYPSLKEGFGFPPLEAMACGTAVIASNMTSIPEIVGNAALLVDAADPLEIAKAINNITKNQALREHLISKGLSQCLKYDWKYAAERTLRIYEDTFANA